MVFSWWPRTERRIATTICILYFYASINTCRSIALVLCWSNVWMFYLAPILLVFLLLKRSWNTIREYLATYMEKVLPRLKPYTVWCKERLEIMVPPPIRGTAQVVLHGDRKVNYNLYICFHRRCGEWTERSPLALQILGSRQPVGGIFQELLPSREWVPSSYQSWGRWRRLWERGVASHLSYTTQVVSLRTTSLTVIGKRKTFTHLTCLLCMKWHRREIHCKFYVSSCLPLYTGGSCCF